MRGRSRTPSRAPGGTWRRLEVRNYRSLERVRVELAPFTVVVGPNASGKSNFADAFVFARDIAADASSAIQARGGIKAVRRWRPEKAADITLEVRVASTREGLESDYVRHLFTLASRREEAWEFRRELIEQYKGGEPAFVLKRERGKVVLLKAPEQVGTQPVHRLGETTSAMLLVRQLVDVRWASGLHNVRRFRLNSEAMRQPQPATERSQLDESGSNIAVAIRHLRQRHEEWEVLLRSMRKLVPGLVGIEEAGFGRYLGVRFCQEQPGGEEAWFDAADMSEGSLRALGIMVAAQQMTRDELLIIEEPEVSIHPGAAAVLFQFLKRASRRGAVLLTTHSAELLDAARDEEILVCDYRQGVTHVGPMEQAQRELVRDGLLSVAELMRSEPLRIEGMPPDVISPEEAG